MFANSPFARHLYFYYTGKIFLLFKNIYHLGGGCLCKFRSSEIKTEATSSPGLWGFTLASLEELLRFFKIQSLANSSTAYVFWNCKENREDEETLTQQKVVFISHFAFAIYYLLFIASSLTAPEIPSPPEASLHSVSATVLTQNKVSWGLPRSDLCCSNLSTTCKRIVEGWTMPGFHCGFR